MKYRIIVALSIIAIVLSHLSFNYLATLPNPSSMGITTEEVNFENDYSSSALTWKGGVKILQFTTTLGNFSCEVHEYNSLLESIKNYTITLPYKIIPIAKLTSSGDILVIYTNFIDDSTKDDTFVYHDNTLVFSESILIYLITISGEINLVSSDSLGLLYESDELSLLDRSGGTTSVIYTYLWKDDHFQQSGSYYLHDSLASIESMYMVNNYYYILGAKYPNPYITTDITSALYKINLQSKETKTIELNNDYNKVFLIQNQTYYVDSTGGYSGSAYKFEIYDDSNQLAYHLSSDIIVEPIIRYNSIQSQIIGHTSLVSISEIGGKTFLPLQKNSIIKTLGNNENFPFALFMGNDEIQVLNIPHELTNETLISTNYIGSTTDSMIYTFTTQYESKLISLQITVKNNSIDFSIFQLPGVLLTYVAVIILNTRQLLKRKNMRKNEELYPGS